MRSLEEPSGVAISPLTPVANPGMKPITQPLFGYLCGLGCDGGRRNSARCPQPYNGPSQNAASGGGGGVNWSRTLPESEKSRRVAEVATAIPGTQSHAPSQARTFLGSPIGSRGASPLPNSSLTQHQSVQTCSHRLQRGQKRSIGTRVHGVFQVADMCSLSDSPDGRYQPAHTVWAGLQEASVGAR